MENQEDLNRQQRRKGQKYALLANMFTPVATYVMTGALMIIFAGDVLNLPASEISRILAIIPLISLIRIFLMGILSRIGKVRLIRCAAIMKGLIILALIFIPSEYLEYRVYLSLLIAFSLINQLGLGTAWQPLLRDITTDNDRGQFFSRMRLVFTLINLIVTGAAPLLIGESVSSVEYRFFLILPFIAQINMMIMVNKIPELSNRGRKKVRSTLRKILHDLKAITRPLMMIILVQFTFFPLFILYLRQGLGLPSNLVSAAVFTGTLGNAFSLLFWGRISDNIGFRNTISGVHLLGFLQIPFLLLIQPSPGLSFTIPLLFGLLMYSFIDGVVMAGSGIAMTSIQHYFSSKEKSLFIFSVYSAVALLVNSSWIFLTGKVIENWSGSFTLPVDLSSVIYLDGVKIFMIAVPLVVRVGLFIFVRTLPNIQPWFGLGDFFLSLNPASIRTMLQTGRLQKMDNFGRDEMSYSLGHRGNPFSIRSLISLLKDPSYDVKNSAIRELGRSGSSLAGEELYPMLKNPKMAIYHEHIAWALGQLRWEEAADDLLGFLKSQRSEKLKAVSARALGRIGCVDAIPVLRMLSKEMTPSFHLSSSACWSLITLDLENSCEYIFTALPLFQDSNIRYEILDLLCTKYKMSNLWILKYGKDQGGWQALQDFIDEQPDKWRDERIRLIDALKTLEYLKIRTLYRENFPWRDNSVFSTFLKILDKQNEWNVLLLLASAQLLLKK